MNFDGCNFLFTNSYATIEQRDSEWRGRREEGVCIPSESLLQKKELPLTSRSCGNGLLATVLRFSVRWRE